MLALIPIMTRVRESGGTDTEAVRQALALWEEIRLIDESTGSIALDYTWLLVRMRTRSFYKAGVEDYFGPPSETFQRAAGLLPAAAGAEAPAPAAQAPAAQAARTSARPQPAEEAWRLVFSDDFQREELGADWRVLEGEWAVSGGELAGHGVLLLDKPFPAFHRLEFEAATDAGAVVLFGERRPAEISDLSCFLQAPAAAGSAGAGYLFQFGGQRNTLHRILRAGETFRSRENPQFRIEPARRHRIVAENDAGALRLTVDGQVLLEGVENASFVGKGQEHAGLYLYTPARIFHVKLHVKSLDDDRI